MQLGMIGLGRMGSHMVRRLIRGRHECVVYDVQPRAVSDLVKEGALGADSLADMLQKLRPPRVVWMMVPAGIVDETVQHLAESMASGDIIIDGGNSYYQDDIARARRLQANGIHYIDVGTSGGVWGMDRGYCLMIGGEKRIVHHLQPIFASLAPGLAAAVRIPNLKPSESTAEQGFLHCGPTGAGHFVKMVHNGIEYGLMAAYAEGMNVLRHANIGKTPQSADAETTPLREPQHYQYDFDVADIAEVWRRGSVIASWLLDLTTSALRKSADLEKFSGRVSDSGEGRWTVAAALDEAVPMPVLSAALYQRFNSRGEADFADKILSAMRYEFGGHEEGRAGTKGT